MRGTLLISLALVSCPLAVASADDSSIDLRRDQDSGPPAAHVVTSGTLAPTPEMWFYEQERSRYEDTRLAIRRRAEIRGQQRQERLAALAWYGMSNSRPTVSNTPWCGGYSAHWGSNSFDPLRWRPLATPLIVSRPTNGPN